METQGTEPASPHHGSTPPWASITLAPPPEFVVVPEFDRTVPRKADGHVTQLCWERQVDLDAGISFHCASTRLETALAVQHQSQWRADFDPRFQRLVLHWLRVVRNGQIIDQLHRDRLRLIQRETQLEHLVIDGQWTLLRVLDDVRVGDSIEFAHSVVGSNPVRANGCEVIYFVPPGQVVGDFKLRLIFSPQRKDIGRLTSDDAPPVSEAALPDGRICWSWSGSQLDPRDPEPNQPSTFFDCIWIQVSDLADWTPLCARLAETWKATLGNLAFADRPEFRRPSEVNEAAIVALVQYLQDEYRYLSVDLESGGWIPQQPDVVAARRYGDCKDMVWLATQVLNQWGVNARPILVGTGLRAKVKTLRPMALLFNHAVLEVEVSGVRRWFDLTMRLQGGDFHHRWIGDFGVGLPVDERGSALVEQPSHPGPSVYAIRETILLDTRRGEPSYVEIRAWAEGPYAENIRRKQFSEGAEEFSRERLRYLQRRYPNAIRLGTLRCRDNREQNIFELAEAFQIKDVLNSDEGGNRALFDIPGNMVIHTLDMPEDRPRRAPWELPYPLELRHQIIVRAGGMESGARRALRWVNPEFIGTVDDPREPGEWSKTIRVKIMAPEVEAAKLPAFRRVLDQFLLATTWRLFLPWGHKADTRPSGFGELPPPEEGVAGYVHAADLSGFVDAPHDFGSETGSASQHGTLAPRTSGPDWANWWIGVPVFIVLAMILVRMIPDPIRESPRSFDARISPSSSAPPPSLTITRKPSFTETERFNTTLPLGSPIHGEVYRSPTEVDRLPEAIYREVPTYPQRLHLLGLEGEALIAFVVTDQGITTQITVEKESFPGFGNSASLAISQWRFRPAIKDGRPVNMAMRIPVVFKLGQDAAPQGDEPEPNIGQLEDPPGVSPASSEAAEETKP